MATLDQFKGQLQGGGARANQFEVTIPWTVAGGDTTNSMYLCRASQLPGQELTPIEVPFRGRKLYIAGDREFADPWTTTFINDTSFLIRNSVERWMNRINHLKTNTGIGDRPTGYMADLTVKQLDRNGVPRKTYIFRDAWPISLSSIDLSSDAADALEEFEVSWRYLYFEASDVTSGGGTHHASAIFGKGAVDFEVNWTGGQ